MRRSIRGACSGLFVALCACGSGSATPDASRTSSDARPDATINCSEPPEPVVNPPANPPFAGTVFIDPDVIRESDPTAFVDLAYMGQGLRQMYDRRTEAFATYNAHLFDAQFGASHRVEIQVNPEFDRNTAEDEARRNATAVGRMPGFLFRDLRTMWIHRGMYLFGGGNNNILIHTEQGDEYSRQGYLEEVMVHEAAHTSLDADHAAAPQWLAAQTADGVAISTYARDFPTREDVAETILPYLAQAFRADRLDPAVPGIIRDSVPARVAYFACLGLTLDLVQ